MQHLDNDMDELFRKAGADYPLKRDSNGWDKIEPLLLGTPALTYISNKKNNLKKYSPAILLLIGFSLLGTFTNRYLSKKDAIVAGEIQQQVMPVMDAIKQSRQTIATKEQALATHPNTSIKRKTINLKISVRSTFIAAKPDKILRSALTDNSETENDITQILTTQQLQQTQSVAPLKTGELDWQAKEILNDKNDTTSNKTALPTLAEPVVNVSAIITNTAAIKEAKKNIKPRRAYSKFYIGFLAGASLNRVKNQALIKPGYDVGLQAGFQLSKKLSIETGLLFEQKNYYTSGEYFNMSKVASSMPVGMKVVSLKGSFSIFELPFTIKYNLRSKRAAGNFYTTAGISTYLMSREYNQYQTLLNGEQKSMTGTYNNQSTYAAASINISFGYQKSIGKSALIRIEPYIQFPLKGVGVGALPVTTTGIHLGVYRFLH